MMDAFRWVREGLEHQRQRREQRKNAPVYRVRSAESPNGGAKIKGAAEDGRRLAEKARLNRLREPAEDD